MKNPENILMENIDDRNQKMKAGETHIPVKVKLWSFRHSRMKSLLHSKL